MEYPHHIKNVMKILVVDDHALFRDGLCHVLQGLDEQVTILEASDHDSAIQHLSENPDLDLVLQDLNMPGKDGFMGLETFSKDYPTIPIVILSASDRRSDIQRALDAGAMGYILKESNSTVMLTALRLILEGEIYVPPVMAQQNSPEQNQNDSNAPALTPRQLQVLTMMVQGHSNKIIAAELDIAEATIKMHVTSIFRSLGVSNRTQAAMAAEKLDLCDNQKSFSS